MNIEVLSIEDYAITELGTFSLLESVDEMCIQVDRLDGSRRQMFIEWLLRHSHAIRFAGDLRNCLLTWLGVIPTACAVWESKLILTEIQWWRDLDEMRLMKIMLECFKNDS